MRKRTVICWRRTRGTAAWLTGLADGDYELMVDGQTVRTYTAAELAAGVNLALETCTPQYQQALAVQAALGKKWSAGDKIRTLAYIEFSAWPDAPRPVDVDVLKPKLEAQLAAANGKSWQPYIREQQEKYLALKPLAAEFPAQAEGAVVAARQAAIIKPHQFSLNRVATSATLQVPSGNSFLLLDNRMVADTKNARDQH